MKTYILASLCLIASVSALRAREFTDLQGRKLDAEIVSASGSQVTLKRTTDGRIFTVTASTLRKHQ